MYSNEHLLILLLAVNCYPLLFLQFGCILECHSVYSKLCHSESATITETDPHSSDKLRAKNKLKKVRPIPHLSDIEIRRKQKAMSSGASQLGRMSGKRRRASGVEASRGEKAEGAGQESSAKRVCQRERRKSTTCTVDFQPLELGSKFKVEIEALNREERAVVSSYTCAYNVHVHVFTVDNI